MELLGLVTIMIVELASFTRLYLGHLNLKNLVNYILSK